MEIASRHAMVLCRLRTALNARTSRGSLDKVLYLHKRFYSTSDQLSDFSISTLHKALKAEKRGETIHDEQMKKILPTVLTLEKHNCRIYQVIENKSVASINPDEIDKHVTKLQTLGINTPSVALIGFIHKGKKLSSITSRCRKHVDSLRGASSMTQCVIEKLNCDENQAVRMVDKHHAIFTSNNPRSQTNFIQKLDMLVESGIDLDHLRDRLEVVRSKSMKSLSSQLKVLSELGIDRNYPVTVLLKTKKQLESFRGGLYKCKSVVPVLCDKLEISEGEAKSLYYWNRLPRNSTVVSSRIDNLLALGYKREQILIQPEILTQSENHVRTVHALMEKYEGDTSDFRMFYIICKRGHALDNITKRPISMKVLLRKILKVEPKHVQDLPEEALDGMLINEREGLMRNQGILLEYGFTNLDIAECVICLAHSSDALTRHLVRLPDYVSQVVQKPITKEELLLMDRKMVLNTLDFFIEKENNFVYFNPYTDQMDSRMG